MLVCIVLVRCAHKEGFSLSTDRLDSFLESDKLKQDDDQDKEALKTRTLELYTDAENKPEPAIPFPEQRNDDNWDCESIVSTYTNTENHYGLITSDSGGQKSHVRLSNKTGCYFKKNKSTSISSFCARLKLLHFRDKLSSGLPIEGLQPKRGRSATTFDTMPNNRHIDMGFLERRKSETLEEKKARKVCCYVC